MPTSNPSIAKPADEPREGDAEPSSAPGLRGESGNADDGEVGIEPADAADAEIGGDFHQDRVNRSPHEASNREARRREAEEDRELIVLAQGGDRTAFRRLVERHQRRAFSIAVGL